MGNANFTDGDLTVSCDGGNSETLDLAAGDIAFSYNAQDGHAVTKDESRGDLTSVRLTTREYPTFSGSASVANPNSAFHKLVTGQAAGYVSTVADIGCGNSVRAVDFEFNFDCGAEVRSYFGEDLMFTSIEFSEGDSSTVTFSGEVLGPFYVKDSSGTSTIVSSR